MRYLRIALYVGLSAAGCNRVVIDVNPAVVGAGKDNVLKAMWMAVDDPGHRAFVAGTMTDTVGIVDLSGPTFSATFRLNNAVSTGKKLLYDAVRDRLWIASVKGDYLWLVDPTTQSTLAEFDTSADIGSGGGDNPVEDLAVDAHDHLYVVRADTSPPATSYSPGRGRIAQYEYDSTLGTIAKRRDLYAGMDPRAVRWDLSRESLVVLTTPSSGATEIHVLKHGKETIDTLVGSVSVSSGAPPSLLAVESGGAFYVAGSSLWKLDGGAVAWKANLPGEATAVEISGGEVGVLQKTGPASDPTPWISRLRTYRTSDGAFLIERQVRNEASRMGPTPSTGGFVVGNGGDASVAILPSGTGAGTTLKVGSAAEDVALPSDGRRVLALNRLGGSQLVCTDLSLGTMTFTDVGMWPVRMALRESQNKLFVLNHYPSQLTVVDLTTLAVVRTISLSGHFATSDTLSDMAADQQGRLLVCMLSELGEIVIVDGDSETILARVSLGAVAKEQGPGRFHAAVDGENRRAFIWNGDTDTLTRVQWDPSYQRTDATVTPGSAARDSYRMSGLYYSRQSDRLFVYDRIVDPSTLTVAGSLADVHRVVGENAGEKKLYAQRIDASGNEYLATLGLPGLHEQSVTLMTQTGDLRSYVFIDTQNGRFAFTDGAESRIYVDDLP